MGEIKKYSTKLLPDILNFLLAWWLGLANKHVLDLLGAARNLQEFIKFQDPALATGPAFATLVENRRAGVVHTFFLLPSSRPIIRFSTTLATARSIGGNFQIRII